MTTKYLGYYDILILGIAHYFKFNVEPITNFIERYVSKR